jgi:Flp pilus assembly pilin Flp
MREENGQALVEYVILLIIVSIGFVAGTQMMRNVLKGLFSLIGAFFSGTGP